MTLKRYIPAALIALWTVLAVLGPGTGAVAYLFLAVTPGLFAYRLATRNRELMTGSVTALVVAPAVVAALGALLLAVGLGARTAATIIVLASGGLGLVAEMRWRGPKGPVRMEMSPLALLGILAMLAAICAVTLHLPLSYEWWRVRSDGWFHGAVVAQINDFGVPPEDPYFLGMPLQYMWGYHVLVLILSRASGIDAFIVMALLNLQALIAFALTPVLITRVLGLRPLHGLCAMLTALFSMNALFWLFLPIKLARAFTGEVRGMEEIRRILTLPTFDMQSVQQITIIFYNHYFFMDKFMVSTPLTLAIAMMAAAWLGVVRYVRDADGFSLMLVAISMVGMLLLHPLFGVITAATLAGGAVVAHIWRRGISRRATVWLIVTFLVTGIATLPYLLSITRATTDDNVTLVLSFKKIAGLIITCALALLLACCQLPRLFRAKDPGSRVLLTSTLVVIVLGLFVAFPGSNLYSKPPFFVIFPLSLIGGWTFVDIAERRAGAAARATTLVLLLVAALAPINLLEYAAYYHTPREPVLTNAEREVATWVRANTPRTAVFFDSGDRVFLLVPGPRRYYWGRESYAKLWGYDPQEMRARRAVRDNLFSTQPLARDTLERLGALNVEAYVVEREGDGSKQRFRTESDVFVPSFVGQSMSVYKIDRMTCRELAAAM